jgi:hypothetical protein
VDSITFHFVNLFKLVNGDLMTFKQAYRLMSAIQSFLTAAPPSWNISHVTLLQTLNFYYSKSHWYV